MIKPAAGYRPLAYSSPKAVQTTGTVAELGIALHARLAETEQAELMPACAQLPTVTPVGMASLLPDAGSELLLAREGDGFAVTLAGIRLGQVAQRMDILR